MLNFNEYPNLTLLARDVALADYQAQYALIQLAIRNLFKYLEASENFIPDHLLGEHIRVREDWEWVDAVTRKGRAA